MKKQTFALYFGNRGFMPAELIEGAREDMVKAVTEAGYDYLIMDKDATRYGAVETRDEGRLYHDWLKSHEGEYDGVILCMPKDPLIPGSARNVLSLSCSRTGVVSWTW